MSDIHLNTVLQNIISNAVKYASDNQRLPNLLKSLKVDNGTRSIIIKDNGIGFDSNFQRETFQTF
jgi:signal transduction histidine kinase